jgi:hypothetical protein
MGLETGIWRIQGNKPQRISPTAMDFEARLEAILESDITVVSEPRKWLVIGRQVPTDHGGRIDLLALDEAGTVIVLELKRDKTDREVVSQVLDYASWVEELDYAQIATLFSKYAEKNHRTQSLEDAFKSFFGVSIPEEVNGSHEMLIVASELHPESERVVRYLQRNFGVPINAVFFNFFKDGESEYLSRSWLAEPASTEEDAEAKPRLWNGEYYAGFGYGKTTVEAGLEYGFMVAGGGDIYAKPLLMLSEGDRVWVHIGSGKGYGGVAEVVEPRQTVDEFTVTKDGGQVPITELLPELRPYADDPDMADYVVRLKWLKKVPSYGKGVWEKGFFANQMTAARPTTPAWGYTVDRLKTLWGVEDE